MHSRCGKPPFVKRLGGLAGFLTLERMLKRGSGLRRRADEDVTVSVHR